MRFRRRYRTYTRQVVITPEEQRRNKYERARNGLADVKAAIAKREALIPTSTAIEEIKNLRQWQQKYESTVREYEQAEEKKRLEEGRKAAIIAAFLEKSRELADDVKKQLVSQVTLCPTCPYCGSDYGDEPHADHIYPVSKGGLSTAENMVLVCGTCNLRKHAKTIRQFIVQYKLDRSFIESTLARLGKTF